MEKVRKQLLRFVQEQAVIPAKVGTVVAVDTSKLLIDVDPLDGGPTMFNVRLVVSESGPKTSGVVTLPKNGSEVIIGQMQAGTWFLIKAAVVDNIWLNGDAMGGLVDWPKAKQELEKMTLRIDAIINAIKASPVTPSDGGATFKAALITALDALQVKESFKNLENKTVKHGSN